METGTAQGVDSELWRAVPVFDPPLHVGRPNVGDRAVFDRLVDGMFERRWLSNDGPLVRELEDEVARYVGVKHCIAVNNGTIGLEIAIRALGLTGEVIVPSYTFVATAHALRWQGLTPVFADIDPRTHSLDPESVRRAITDRTSGILAVHLWGRPAQVDELQAIADEHGLQLFFDAAHAFGCAADGTRIGGFGRVEVFSFHATKFFNSFEGGALVTNDDELATRMRLMRNFGFAGNDNVVSDGTNAKMTEVCAAMGLTNLAAIDGILETNRSNYRAYEEHLADVPHIRLNTYDDGDANNYQYVTVMVDDESPLSRDGIVEALTAKGVLARKYFWPGAHRMSPYRELDPGAGERLPNTEEVARRLIVLPTGTAVDGETVATVCSMLRILTGGDVG